MSDRISFEINPANIPRLAGEPAARARAGRKSAASALPLTQWATLAQVADHLSISPKTARKLIASGHLPASRIGGTDQIRVKIADVEALMGTIPTA